MKAAGGVAGRRGGGRLLDDDPLAGRHGVALRALGAVDPHEPGVDQPLRRGARAGVAGEEDVEPLAGRRGVDDQLSGGHGRAVLRARRAG